MSSAENGKPAGRLVWISDEMRGVLQQAYVIVARDDLAADIQQLVAQWDAAPADAAEAVEAALVRVTDWRNTVPAVLQALGVPSPQPTRSDNP